MSKKTVFLCTSSSNGRKSITGLFFCVVVIVVITVVVVVNLFTLKRNVYIDNSNVTPTTIPRRSILPYT